MKIDSKLGMLSPAPEDLYFTNEEMSKVNKEEQKERQELQSVYITDYVQQHLEPPRCLLCNMQFTFQETKSVANARLLPSRDFELHCKEPHNSFCRVCDCAFIS